MDFYKPPATFFCQEGEISAFQDLFGNAAQISLVFVQIKQRIHFEIGRRLDKSLWWGEEGCSVREALYVTHVFWVV